MAPPRHCEGPLRPERPEAIPRPRSSVRTSRSTSTPSVAAVIEIHCETGGKRLTRGARKACNCPGRMKLNQSASTADRKSPPELSNYLVRDTKCSTGVGRPTFLTGKASKSCFSTTEIVVAASEVERGGYGEIFGPTTGSPVGSTGSPWSGVESARRTIRSVVHNHRPSNKALHLTKVATNGLTPFAGERRCWTDHQGLQH